MLNYDVWSEEDIKNRGLAEEGIYPFRVLTVSEDKTKPGYDKQGNVKPIRDMLVLELLFTDRNGIEKTVKDWIVFMKGMDWKVRHLASTIGELERYEKKELDVSHIQGKRGSVLLGVKEYQGNDGKMKKGNYVQDYVVDIEHKPSALNPLPMKDNIEDDVLPF